MGYEKTYAKGGILDEDPKRVLIETAYAHDCEGAELLQEGLYIADLAWALALGRAGGVRDLEGLIEALVRTREFPIDPAYGDVYNAKTVALHRFGDAAEDLHRSRPRREAINVAFDLTLRAELFELTEALRGLGEALIARSRAEAGTLMPDLTYFHHAQPTTFGHYVMTFFFPLARDFERLALWHRQHGRSVAGSGSVNGCSLPIDRAYLARLLGFEAYETHARDALWRADLPYTLMAMFGSITANVGRMAEEFQIFTTAEFGWLRLPASLSRASVIMPQKQNPYPLTYLRGVANETQGKVVSYLAYAQVPSANPDSRTFVYVDCLKQVRKVAGALRLAAAVVASMTIDKGVLRQKVAESFFYATDLADWLVDHAGLGYEEAHRRVGEAIRRMRQEGGAPSSIDASILGGLIDNASLRELIDPARSLARKRTPGGVGELERICQTADDSCKDWRLPKNDFALLRSELERIGYVVEFAL